MAAWVSSVRFVRGVTGVGVCNEDSIDKEAKGSMCRGSSAIEIGVCAKTRLVATWHARHTRNMFPLRTRTRYLHHLMISIRSQIRTLFSAHRAVKPLTCLTWGPWNPKFISRPICLILSPLLFFPYPCAISPISFSFSFPRFLLSLISILGAFPAVVDGVLSQILREILEITGER